MAASEQMCDCQRADRCAAFADHRCSRGDAAEGARAGRGPEEAGHDQTAAVQVPPLRAAGGRSGTVRACGVCV